MQILVVEDDVDIAELVAFNLERQGWGCALVHHGAEGWEMIQRRRPDLVILDVMLPGMDGMQIFRAMKENEMTRGIPAIFLTARGALDDRLEGLSLGADDYVTKPFSPKELVARINALVRRLNIIDTAQPVEEEPEDDGKIVSGKFVILQDERKLLKDGKEIELTPIEYTLVKYFMENANKAVHRDEILNNVWGYNYVGDFKIVDVNIRRIRQKIEDDPSNPKYIEKVWGYGYRWSGGGE